LLDIFDTWRQTLDTMRTAEHSARELGSRTARQRLPIQARPYFTHVQDGLSLGYRRGKRGGSWIARAYDTEHGYRFEPIGRSNDLAEGVGMSFQQAQDAARNWYAQLAIADAGEIAPKRYTVAQACSDYLDRFTGNENSKSEAARTIRVHVIPTLGNIELAKLKRAKLESWLHDLANAPRWNREGKPSHLRSRRASANRIWNTLRAALNRAYKAERVASSAAWERVEAFENVDVPKRDYFTAEQAKRFIEACPEDFQQLVRGALYTGCRYGELIGMTVEAFDENAGHVSVLQGKTGRMKHAHLTDEETAFFAAIAKSKSKSELMFLRSDVKPWGKSHQQDRMAEACKAAGVPLITFRALRTTFATLLAMNGTSIALIADQLGHAGQTVAAKHYAHYAPSHVATIIRANKPSFAVA
jgi:integrase